MAIIGIHYSGGNYYNDDDILIDCPIEYHKVYLHTISDDEYIFDTGDFIKDWYNAKKKFLEFYEREGSLKYSSTVDHFIEEGAPYEKVYLIPEVEYDYKGKLDYDYKENGLLMFVNKGDKLTWEELKKYCKL